MLKRFISGSVYVFIIAVLFVLRQFVDYRIFDLFFYFCAIFGTRELLNVFGDKISEKAKKVILVYSFVSFPLCFLLNQFYVFYSVLTAFIVVALIFALILLIISLNENSDIKHFLINLFLLLYPLLFTVIFMQINDNKNGFVALLLLFFVSSCSDVFAYLIGMAITKLKKGEVKKLAPKISPNKTVAGGIGGILGGILGGLLVLLIFKNSFVAENIDKTIFFISIGFIGSILNQVGDLFESFIKRKLEVKDMGNIMPGHGGVLDRIDGMMFLGVLILIAFSLV